MTYEISLIEADIRDAMEGVMLLGLLYEGVQQAKLEYRWDDETFTAIFHGNAPSLPVAAHPTELLQKPIAALHAHKSDRHRLITDVFRDHSISISINQ